MIIVYPEGLLQPVCARAYQGFDNIGCRKAILLTDDAIHSIRNESWIQFWRDPSGYHNWEKSEVRKLLYLCRVITVESGSRRG
jgi:hypothetical protein